ncbi:MAG: hypothetical protein B7C24_05270 [Bacteroidetes bacterium 4572_77]|nr:MAG: hypothetical protein B7C24_05270 [Bacteroidetes bacterium 4572_77]
MSEINIINKKYLKLAVIISLASSPITTFAQPTPGDTGLGAASGQVVGGGADLGNILWILLPAFLYIIYKNSAYFTIQFSRLTTYYKTHLLKTKNTSI